MRTTSAMLPTPKYIVGKMEKGFKGPDQNSGILKQLQPVTGEQFKIVYASRK
jgi:hypothetical protein